MIKKIFVYFILTCFFFNYTNSANIKIVSKINNEIITNIDIENEKKFLLLLNNNLSKISKKEMFNLAKNSLIREKIKKSEIEKIFDKKDNEKFEKKLVKNFYTRLGLTNKPDFISFLNSKNINFEELKSKLIYEALWNRIIYSKFNDRVKIDEENLKQKIRKQFQNKNKKYEYNLSEILIDIQNNQNSKINEIIGHINKFGFKTTANKYSKSDTSKYGGEIGWIKSTRLSKKISKEISKIKIGEITDIIKTANGYLILKLNDKKEIKEKLDLDKELKQQINYERNRQLNQLSLIYYKKLKQNIIIYDNK